MKIISIALSSIGHLYGTTLKVQCSVLDFESIFQIYQAIP